MLEPSVRARAIELVDGEPDNTTADARRLRFKHAGVSLQALGPGGRVMQSIPKTLFVGWGVSVVSYYRAFLPAIALGADYVAWSSVDEKANELVLVTGLGASTPQLSDLFDYEVVIIQQPRGARWLRLIRELQAAGVVVLYEIDDYIQSARKIKSHELVDVFDADFVARAGAADDGGRRHHLLDRLHRAPLPHVQRAHVGVLQRHRPQALRLGQAGPRGRHDRLGRAASATRPRSHAGSRRCATSCVPGPRRASCPSATAPRPSTSRSSARSGRSPLPPGKIEVYPAAMTLFDIAIAPSSESNLFKGKSDLRWLEASALGIPLVAHPDVYPEIEDGVTGVHARTTAEVEAALLRLIDDAELRERVGTPGVRLRRRAPAHRRRRRALAQRAARSRSGTGLESCYRSTEGCRLSRSATDG